MSDYNLKARRILRKAIKHWCIDILRPFKKGDKIETERRIFPNLRRTMGRLIWTNTRERVGCYTYNCPLCVEYRCQFAPGYYDETDPSICPLYVYAGKVSCGENNSAWHQFYVEKDMASARSMIKELVGCLKAYGG